MPNKNLFVILVAVFLAGVIPAMAVQYNVPTAAYPDIATALGAASSGDTIYVMSSYTSNDTFPLTISIDDLVIRGDNVDPLTTSIHHQDYPGGDINDIDDIFLLDEVSEVTFSHIAFHDCNFAIKDEDSSETKTDITVRYCTFTNCRNADDSFDLAHKFTWDGGAIHLSNISTSEFYKNDITGCGEGIYLYNSDQNNVHHNTIIENGQFGIMLDINYTSNFVDYNTVISCQDKGIVLYDNPYNSENKYHMIRHNFIQNCNAEGLLIKGCQSGDDQTGPGTEISFNHICSGNGNSGKYASINGYGDDDGYRECEDLTKYYTNFGALAVVDCGYLELTNNIIHCNGETQVDGQGDPEDNGLTCFGGLAIICSKDISFINGVLENNTGDNTEYVGVDDRYNCGAYVYDEMHLGSTFKVNYCDIFNQIWGIRGEFVKNCVSGNENWWGNPNGPHNLNNDCGAFNNNPGAPELNEMVSCYQWEGCALAIELEGFRASSYTGETILIEWSTGSEQDNAGFYLIRSEKLTSDFILLNNKIIPTRGEAVSGAHYSFVDDHITPNVQYYYWLVDVDYDGEFSVNGPVRGIFDLDPITNPNSLVY